MCPFGDYNDTEESCACHSNAYSRGWYPELRCDVLRPIRCRINLIGFQSDCGYDKDDPNNQIIFGDTYCKTMDMDSTLTVKYWVECRMEAAAATADQPYGYAMNSEPLADPARLLVESNEGVILDVVNELQLDITVQAVNFGKVKDNKLVLHNTTLSTSELAYTIDSVHNVVTRVQELTFTTPLLTSELITPHMKAPFPDHAFTNRLFVEIAGKPNIEGMAVQSPVYGPESTVPIVVVNSKWIYLDFPSLPLPGKVYVFLSGFEITMIIIGAVVGTLIILYVGYLLCDWYVDYREYKKEALAPHVLHEDMLEEDESESEGDEKEVEKEKGEDRKY